MKAINKFFLLASLSVIMFSCSEEETDVSTITKFPAFSFESIQDSYVFDEADTLINIPFTFNDNQIYAVEVEIGVGANSTATEDVDFALGAHTLEIPTLTKAGNIEFYIGTDVFREDDEKVYLTLTSHHPSGYPTSKTIEITIKNVGGCPTYVHSDFVGEYSVVSDGWNDWAPGTDLTVTDEGTNKLGFKYNCGADAATIVVDVDPDDFSISSGKQEYCSYNLPPLTRFLADVVEGTGSFVNTCNGELYVTMAHSDANGANYGNYQIVLKKK